MPTGRPSFIHEYALSEYSLYAAMSVGLETNDIIEVLGRLSKVSLDNQTTFLPHATTLMYRLPQTPLPARLVRDIRRWTSSYGKLKLVLKKNTYTLESSSSEIILKMLEDEVISRCRILPQPVEGVDGVDAPPRGGTGPDSVPAGSASGVGVGPDGVEVAAISRTREAGDMISAVIGIDRSEFARS